MSKVCWEVSMLRDRQCAIFHVVSWHKNQLHMLRCEEGSFRQ